MRRAATVLVLSVACLLGRASGGDPFRFTISSDNRPVFPENIPNWEHLLDEITANVVDEGVFHIIAGDFDYPGTTDASLKAEFGTDVLWYPLVGNHEIDQESGSGNDWQWVLDAYPGLPYIVNEGPPGSEGTTYSFDYGIAHFVALNEYYNGTNDRGTDGDIVDALYDWLAADLEANAKPVVFVLGHEPAYPEYRHVGDSLDQYPAKRDRFWKLLNDEQVVAFFCGHTHYYYSKTVDGPDWDPVTWQVDCGNAGNGTPNTFVDVTVTDTKVTFAAWQGTVGVPYTLVESWSVPVPASGTIPAAPANLTATAGPGQNFLDWDDNPEPDLAGYNVYRGLSSLGPYSRISGDSTEPLDLVSVTAETGEKPQSKVWFHDSTWWSVLPRSDGTWVWRLDGSAWTPVLQISNSTSVKADCKAAGGVTHILLYTGVSSQLASVEYVPGSPGTYQTWSGRPGLVDVTLGSGVETATIDIDSTGRMWLGSDASTTIEVRYSDSPYESWSGPVTLATGVGTDDICVITALPDNTIGVLWSNQQTKRFGFRVHADGDDPAAWSADEVPASQSALNVGAGMADDHLNLAVASDGTLYAAVKTSYDLPGYPKIAFLVRRPSGAWDDLYEVDQSGTRPIVLLNEALGTVMVVYTASEGYNPILFRESSLNPIAFGPAHTLLGDLLNNVSSTKQNYTDSLVVIASNSSQAAGVHMTFDVNVNPLLSEYVDLHVTPGKTYYYVVAAVNTSGEEGPNSNEASATALPLPASNLTATAVSYTDIDLVWSDNASDEDGFAIERTINGVVWTEIATVGPGVTSYPDTGLTALTAYTYRVLAFSTAGGYLLYSNIASATTEPGNRPPVADDQDVKTTRDTPVDITLTASDPDGDPLTYFIVDLPLNGDLTGTPPNVTYTPDPGFVGSDSFTFQAYDGDFYSNLGTVSITVSEPPPQHALATQVTVNPGTVSGTVEATHADDGAVQNLSETATGPKGRARLVAEYILVTAANPSEITGLTLGFKGSWSNIDTDDALVADVYNVSTGTWESLGWTVGSDMALYEATLSAAYVDAAGEIRVRFSDTGEIDREKKDTLSVDLLIGLVTAGPDLPPSPPTGLQATAGDTLVDLTWDANGEADLVGYNVYRDGGLVAELGTETQYTDTDLPNGVEYTYTVTAVDATHESNLSSPASATPLSSLPPRPPSDLTATAGTGQVTLTWNGNLETNVSTYHVYRSTTAPVVVGPGTLLAQVAHQGAVGHQYDDTDVDVTEPTTFYYVVVAVDGEGDPSAPSNEVSATVYPASQEELIIITAEYAAKPSKLTVVATSSLGGSVTLTLYGGPEEGSIDWENALDTMNYDAESGQHSSRTRTSSPPLWVGVRSTGGGIPATSPVTMK